MFRIPYRWARRPWANLMTMYRNLYHGIANIFRWAPIIWFDQDWDWSYLATIMEYKLRRSAHLEETTGHHVGSLRDARNMRTCAELLHRLQEDNYYENAMKRFGHNRFAGVFAQRQQRSDQHYLGLILGKYLTHWWD